MRYDSLFVKVLLLFLGILLIISGVLLINKPSDADWFGENETIIVPAGEYLIREKELDEGVLEVIFNVTKSDLVKFLVLDESNYLKWTNDQPYQTPAFIQEGGTPLTGSGELYIFITDGKWFFIWDNSYDLTSDKKLTEVVRFQPHQMLEG